MAETADMARYRQEWVDAFQQKQSLLRGTCTTEAMISGKQAVFAVTGNNQDEAVTRGINGQIPYQPVTNSQYTATLVEAHAPYSTTEFNVFAAQADMRRALQKQGVATINRAVDKVVITELLTATQDAGTVAEEMSLDRAMHARTILLNNEVELDGEIYFLITPAAEAYMLQTPEFSNSQYRAATPLANGESRPNGPGAAYAYAQMKWVVHNKLPSLGTASEKCILYHRSAIGHAINGPETFAGHDEQQGVWWFRGTVYHAAKLLQNSGVVLVPHDGTGYVAS